MPEVWIALGSNLGDRRGFLQEAVEGLSSALEWRAISRIYETAPMYITDQPSFLNAVGMGFTELSPLALLRFVKELETRLGRTPREHNGPREIDIDLLAYGGLELTSGDRLILPHPRISERRFVLAPWAEIGADVRIPNRGTVRELLAQTIDPADSVHPLLDAVLLI